MPDFQPHPTAEQRAEHKKASLRPLTFVFESVMEAPFHFGGLVPHFVLVFYGLYRLGTAWGIVPPYNPAVALALLPLVQGVAAGVVAGSGGLRYGPTGRRLKRKEREGAATDAEINRLQYSDMAFAFALYTLIAV